MDLLISRGSVIKGGVWDRRGCWGKEEEVTVFIGGDGLEILKEESFTGYSKT